jgi:hypothetical protein
VAYSYPSGKLGPPGAEKRLVAVLPALAAALWWAVHFARLRSGRRELRFPALHTPGLALPLAALALLAFVPANLLHGLDRVVVCLDLESGELLWEETALRAPAEQKYPISSYATPTAAADGERVFAYFGAGRRR